MRPFVHFFMEKIKKWYAVNANEIKREGVISYESGKKDKKGKGHIVTL